MGVSGFARFSASLARVRFGASAPFGARADNGTAARRAAASAASAGAWKPHGRRADAGRKETLEPRSGETLSSETARFCFDPRSRAGLAMARRYPAARGRTGREAAPRERWPGFATSGREAKARRGSTPIPRAQPRAARRARVRRLQRVRARPRDGVARRDAPRRAERGGANGARPRPRPRPRGPRRRGRGRARREGQGGFLLGFLPPSERGLRSPLELRRHGVALQRDAPQRGLAPVRPRLLHAVQRLFRGQGRPRSGAVGGRGRLRRGNRGIRDRLLRTSYRRAVRGSRDGAYDSANSSPPTPRMAFVVFSRRARGDADRA